MTLIVGVELCGWHPGQLALVHGIPTLNWKMCDGLLEVADKYW